MCLKIKVQKGQMWIDDIEHHLYHLESLATLSFYQWKPWVHSQKMKIDIVSKFRKFVGLNPVRSTTSKEFIGWLAQQVGIFGIPKEIRSDGGSQFSSQLSEDLAALLGYKHVVVPYQLQANGFAERRMPEVMKHLHALVFEKRIKN